jgi:hypothetical protein
LPPYTEFLGNLSDREIRSNIFKSLLLNSISLTSIYAFDLLLQPLVHNHPSWLHRNVGWFYRVLWLLPVVGVSYYLNVRAWPGVEEFIQPEMNHNHYQIFICSELLVQPYRETVLCPSTREPRNISAASYLQRYADHAGDIRIPCCHDCHLCRRVIRIGVDSICRIMDKLCIHVLG